jgi:hypothetical protein
MEQPPLTRPHVSVWRELGKGKLAEGRLLRIGLITIDPSKLLVVFLVSPD